MIKKIIITTIFCKTIIVKCYYVHMKKVQRSRLISLIRILELIGHNLKLYNHKLANKKIIRTVSHTFYFKPIMCITHLNNLIII